MASGGKRRRGRSEIGSIESGGKRRRRCSSSRGGKVCGIDRISDLPESIISYILSFLPTKSGFATSFLSKAWEGYWTKVSTFDLDDDLFPKDGNIDFVEFGNKVLVNQTYESIEKLRLSWLSPNLSPTNLTLWIVTAISRNLRVLDLAAFTKNIEFRLPDALYTCRTLEVLHLQGQIVVSVSECVVCLPKLYDLLLGDVKYESEESLPKLMSGCPVLQSLAVESEGFIDNVVIYTISSASLKSLAIMFYNKSPPQGRRDMRLEIDAPALEKLRIEDVLSRQISIRGELTQLCSVYLEAPCLITQQVAVDGTLQAFHRAGTLKILRKTMFAIFKATNRLSATFERLKILHLSMGCYGWKCLVDFMDCCMQLQFLAIAQVGEPYQRYWKDPVRIPRCLSSLRFLAFYKFDGLEDEMAVLKFILQHGLVLERVYLWFGKCDPSDSERRCEMLNKLSKISRASPTCEFVEWNPRMRIRVTE